MDGVRGDAWDEIGGPMEVSGCIGYPVRGRFSDDSQHFVYRARRGHRWHAVYDGKATRGYAHRQRTPRLIGPHEGHFAFAVETETDAYFVVDGTEQQHFRYVGDFVFSPGGTHYAYAGTGRSFSMASRA